MITKSFFEFVKNTKNGKNINCSMISNASSAAIKSEAQNIHITTCPAPHTHSVRLNAKNAIVKYRRERIDDLSREYVGNPKTTDIAANVRSHRT